MRSSYNAGKVLVTEFAKARKFRKPPAAWRYRLSSEQVKKDKNVYQIFTVENAGVTTQHDLQTAYEWYQTISAGNVEVHEASVEAAAEENEAAEPAAPVYAGEEPPPPEEVQY